MKNPKLLEPIVPGCSYQVPTYVVTNQGIEDGKGAVINFCKGDKSNPEIFRQEGFFTETLIQVAKEYLESVNKGELATRETAMAITKLDETLMWLDKRRQDRELRGVLSTYKK